MIYQHNIVKCLQMTFVVIWFYINNEGQMYKEKTLFTANKLYFTCFSLNIYS